MTDQSGSVVWKADYKPFGYAEVDPASTVVNDFRFPGQTFDSETGYHYNWNRYYDPETGRYLTADPIGLAGGLNLYAYVKGNPVNRIDPKGLKDQLDPSDFGFSEDDYYVPNFNEGSEECKTCKLLCENQYLKDPDVDFWYDEMESSGDYCSITPDSTFCEGVITYNFFDKAAWPAEERRKECLNDCAKNECAPCDPFARN